MYYFLYSHHITTTTTTNNNKNKEMYYQLREKAMLDKKMICMRGVRIPITPERSPENIDYDDILTEILRQKDLETSPIVFNCQMGKGWHRYISLEREREI